MGELDCEESWAPKNWCFWTVVLEKTLESPLDCKEIQPVHPKGDQSWVFIGRTDVEAETPILWPPNAENWLTGKAWCWEGLGAGGEGDDRGWDGWMASLTRWMWWWTWRPGVLRFMGSQRVNTTERLNWTEWSSGFPYFLQFKSEFGNKEFMIRATVSSQSCFCWLYRASPSLAAKSIINLISVSTIWWCPCVESSLVLLEEDVCYDQWVLLAKLC